MSKENIRHKHARESLIQRILDEIGEDKDYGNFYLHAYCAIAKVGLQLKAQQERLFEMDDWADPKSKDELMEKLTSFLTKYIR